MPRLRLNYKFTVLHVRQKSPILLTKNFHEEADEDDNNEESSDHNYKESSVTINNIENSDTTGTGDINQENKTATICENNEINTSNEINMGQTLDVISNIQNNDDKKTSAMKENEDELRGDALLKLSVTNGKVRRILDTVLGIQSWPFGTKKEPACPDPSQILVGQKEK